MGNMTRASEALSSVPSGVCMFWCASLSPPREFRVLAEMGWDALSNHIVLHKGEGDMVHG